MKRVIGWWYIPLVVLVAIFALYAGLVGYRLVKATNSPSGDQNTGQSGFWDNLTTSMGINTRSLRGEHSGRVNFLLAGVAGTVDNTAPDLTDTIMFVSVDIKNHKIDMFSIPRDLYVDIPGFGKSKINAAYELGKNTQAAGGGMQLLEDTVYKILGQKADYYVKIDFEGFVKAIDALGGVDVVVENDIYDYMYPGPNDSYEVFSIKAGPQHLDGETALKYCRSRETTSDFDRARRQQQVIMAAKKAFLDKGLVGGAKVLIQLIDIVSTHLETDLKAWEWERIGQIAKDWGDDVAVTNFVFDDSSGYLYSDQVDGSYVLLPNEPDFSDIHQYVEQTLNNTAVKKESAVYRFSVINGTNRAGLAGGMGDKLKVDGQIVVEVGNTPDNVAVSYAKCNSDADIKSIQKYLKTKWNITKVDKSDVAMGNLDCQIVLGDDFNLN
jgi:LCP family protein required for cell wall assembly